MNALSKCIKFLPHFMKDPQGNTLSLKSENMDPNFKKDPEKLKKLFDSELEKERTSEFTGSLGLGIGSIKQLFVPPVELKIALVDLTGDANNPQYVGFGDKDRIGAASLGKLAPIYATHQLKFDAQAKVELAPAKLNPEQKRRWVFNELRNDWKAKGLLACPPPPAQPQGNCQPVLEKILIGSDSGNLIFKFEPQFLRRMKDITDEHSDATAMNMGAGYLIEQIQYPYMASALLQSGLCDTKRGGFWLSFGYGYGKLWKCGGKLVTLFPKQRLQEVTASAAATYLILMAQKRLVDQQTSQEIKEILKNGDVGWLMDDLPQALEVGRDSISIFGKHGMFLGNPRIAHEAMLIERQLSTGRGIKYVIVCLTRSDSQRRRDITAANLMEFLTSKLIPTLDGVIVQNNS